MTFVIYSDFCRQRKWSYNKTNRNNASDVLLFSTNLYVRETETLELHWSSFLAPFKRQLWFAIIAAIIFLTMLLLVSHKLSSYYGNSDSQDENLWELIYCVYGAFCGQGNI